MIRMTIRLLLVGLTLLLSRDALAQSTDQVTYYHVDAIGSVRVITDANRQVLQRHDYLPFGEEYPPPTQVDKRLFAGKERDPESGFDYLGARYYASGTGRFTTVDPLLDQQRALVDPQQWNRYAYALGNPLKYEDPDGRSATLAGAFVGAAIGGGYAFFQGGSWREVVAAGAGGAIAGAMFGSVVDTGGASLPVLLATGGLAGVEAQITRDAINGRQTTVQDAGYATAGGVAGAATGVMLGRVGGAVVDKWSREPRSLMDQMTLDAAKSGAGRKIIDNLGDPRFKGMEKWEYTVKSAKGLRSTVHYVRDPRTGELMDFKFGQHAED